MKNIAIKYECCFRWAVPLNAVVKLLGLKLDFLYPLSSKFRSLARNKYTSDYNEIYKNYAQPSQVYTYQKS